MIYIVSIVMIGIFGIVLINYPEYAGAWALINTLAVMAVSEDFFLWHDIEEVAAAVVAWFVAPFYFVVSL